MYMPLSMFYRDFLYDISLQGEYFVSFNSKFSYFSIYELSKSITQNCMYLIVMLIHLVIEN